MPTDPAPPVEGVTLTDEALVDQARAAIRLAAEVERLRSDVACREVERDGAVERGLLVLTYLHRANAERDALRTQLEEIAAATGAGLSTVDGMIYVESNDVYRAVSALRTQLAEMTTLAEEYQSALLIWIGEHMPEMKMEHRALKAQLAAAEARVEELETGLNEISEQLPCDEPCPMGPTTPCRECGHRPRQSWCAGCIARLTLAGTPG